MKAILALLTAAFIVTISSCGQCNTCRKYPAADVKLCKKDYTEASYTDAIHYWESEGYDCD